MMKYYVTLISGPEKGRKIEITEKDYHKIYNTFIYEGEECDLSFESIHTRKAWLDEIDDFNKRYKEWLSKNQEKCTNCANWSTTCRGAELHEDVSKCPYYEHIERTEDNKKRIVKYRL